MDKKDFLFFWGGFSKLFERCSIKINATERKKGPSILYNPSIIKTFLIKITISSRGYVCVYTIVLYYTYYTCVRAPGFIFIGKELGFHLCDLSHNRRPPVPSFSFFHTFDFLLGELPRHFRLPPFFCEN